MDTAEPSTKAHRQDELPSRSNGLVKLARAVDKFIVHGKWERPWLQYMSDMATVVGYSAAGTLLSRHPSWFAGSQTLATVAGLVIYVVSIAGLMATGTDLMNLLPSAKSLPTWRQRLPVLAFLLTLTMGGYLAVLVARVIPVEGENATKAATPSPASATPVLTAAQVHESAATTDPDLHRHSPWPAWIGPSASSAPTKDP